MSSVEVGQQRGRSEGEKDGSSAAEKRAPLTASPARSPSPEPEQRTSPKKVFSSTVSREVEMMSPGIFIARTIANFTYTILRGTPMDPNMLLG